MFLNKKQFNSLRDAVVAQVGYGIYKNEPHQIQMIACWKTAEDALVGLDKIPDGQPALRINSSGDLHIEPEFPRAKQQRVGTMKEFDDVIKAAFEPENYRVVPRGLLEHCLDTFETWKFLPTSDSGKQLRKNIDIAIAQLKASLVIEKKELIAKAVEVNSFKGWTCGFCGASSQNSEAEIPHKWACPSK